MSGYFSLHNHTDRSNYRLIDSINTPKALITRAFDLGLGGIAITDHACLSAHMEAQNIYEAQLKKNEAWKDFKVILGDEIYLCRNGLNAENYNSKTDSFYHFILLAKNARGHEQLRELSTISYRQSFMRSKMRRVPTYYKDLERIIGKEPGNVIFSTACLGSYIGKKLLEIKKSPEIEEEMMVRIRAWCQYLQSIGGKENFYLELQPSDNKEQIFVNNRLLKLSDELGIPAIVTTDSHMLSKEDRPLHKAYLNSKEGDREVDEFYASAYLMSEEEIHSFMDKYVGVEKVNELLENTKRIGEQIENYSLKQPFRLPYLPSEKDIIAAKNPVYNLPVIVNLSFIWNKFMESEEPANRIFIKRIIDKCNSNPSYFWGKQQIEKMEYELKTVWDSSEKQNIAWSKYFLQVADYIDIMWNDGDTIVAPGRGSGVGFYLNYLLDIIQIDPLREKAPTQSWRFLNPQRASILDIDTDIQANRRNKCIAALQKRYGKDRVVRVATERTEGSKSAILTAARGLNIDVDTAQYIASLIESDRGKQRSLHDTYYGNEEEDFAPNKTFQAELEKYPELWTLAQRIEGLVCGQSSHAGGVNIYDRPVTCSNSIMKLNSGEEVTAFDLHRSEEAGDVKIDLLATDGLVRVRACLDLLVEYGYIQQGANLRETYENALGIYKMDRNDPLMWDRLSNNEILSVFQFDTPQGKQAINLARPNSVEELASLNAILRLMASEKGAEQPLEKYARFKQNPLDWEREMDNYGLTKDEKKLLHGYLDYEYGLCGLQEDIMTMIQDPQLGGWSLADSDRLRKSVAKKDKKLYEALTEEYFKTVKEKNLSENLCNYFWKVLVKMQAGYSFK